jgi:hypothetical protein
MSVAGTIDPFRSAWLKISRARKHADDLEAELAAWWGTGPVSIKGTGVMLTDGGGTGVRTTTVESVRPLPDSVALLSGDAAHNVRSALDHFAWAAVPARRRNRKTMFPIWGKGPERPEGKEEDEWKEQVRRQMPGVSPGLEEAVLRPRRWPTELWYVNELDRVDKHRLLISVAAAHTGVVVGIPTIFAPVPWLRARHVNVAQPGWKPLEAGTVLWDVPEGADPAPDVIRFEYQVTFGEPRELRGNPVVAQLRILATWAEIEIQRLATLV